MRQTWEIINRLARAAATRAEPMSAPRRFAKVYLYGADLWVQSYRGPAIIIDSDPEAISRLIEDLETAKRTAIEQRMAEGETL